MFESQLKLDLKSQYFEYASISEGSEMGLLSVLVLMPFPSILHGNFIHALNF